MITGVWLLGVDSRVGHEIPGELGKVPMLAAE